MAVDMSRAAMIEAADVSVRASASSERSASSAAAPAACAAERGDG
jgi:hypothetical protein